MNSVFIIVSSACFFLLLFGFVLGFARNWCRSLIRLGIVLVDFVLSFIFSSLIGRLIVSKVSTGTSINILKFSIDFEEIAKELLGENFNQDFALISEEVTALAKALLNVFVNLALFFLIFFVILIVSLVIYWIVLVIVKCTSKKKTDQKNNNGLALRLLGGFEGAFTMLIICFTLLIPVFGIMNVCDNFLDNAQKTQNIPVASAYSPNNQVCGQLFYTEDAKIGKVEGYIETYSSIKEGYNKSPMGKVFRVTKIDSLGKLMFKYLTTVDYQDKKVSLSDEVVVIVETYNIYKDNFKENKFDITQNSSLDGITELVDTASESVIASRLVEKLVPVVAERMINGEKFFGFSISVQDEYRTIFNDSLEVFKSTRSLSRIKFNISTLINSLKILNEHNFIFNFRDNGLIDSIKNDETLVGEVLVSLASTEEIRNNLPAILNDSVALLYNQILGETLEISSAGIQFNIADWEIEANTIQNIVNNLMSVYSSLNENPSQNNLLNELENIGKTIDYSRQSAVLSNSLKSFMIGFISSESVNLDNLNPSVKETIITYINDKWDFAENPTFSFEDNFKTLAETTFLANAMLNGEEIELSNLNSLIVEIIQNNELKTQTVEFLTESNLIQSIVGESNSADVLTGLISSFVLDSTLESLESDILAGQVLVDILNLDNSITLNAAEIMINTIASSNVIMSYIEDSVSTEEKSSLQNLIDDKLSVEEKMLFEYIVQNSEVLAETDKEVLEKLFYSMN